VKRVGTHIFIRVPMREHTCYIYRCIWVCRWVARPRGNTYIYPCSHEGTHTLHLPLHLGVRCIRVGWQSRVGTHIFIRAPVREHTYLCIYMREGSKEVPWIYRIYIYMCSESGKYVCVCVCVYMFMCVFPQGFSLTYNYGVALVSRIDEIICLPCKRAL